VNHTEADKFRNAVMTLSEEAKQLRARAEAAEALVGGLREALCWYHARHEAGRDIYEDYDESSKQLGLSRTALAKTPADMGAELTRLRQMHLSQFTNLEQAYEERDALRARVAELERDNARLQMELDASCSAEELRQVREALAGVERDKARLIEAGNAMRIYEQGTSLAAAWDAAMAKEDAS
jgi:regulator of replication initiation timing